MLKSKFHSDQKQYQHEYQPGEVAAKAISTTTKCRMINNSTVA